MESTGIRGTITAPVPNIQGAKTERLWYPSVLLVNQL